MVGPIVGLRVRTRATPNPFVSRLVRSTYSIIARAMIREIAADEPAQRCLDVSDCAEVLPAGG